MKVVAIVGERKAEIVDRPTPVAVDNFVVVKILSSPMCTEVGDFLKGNRSDRLGHEAAGEVVEVARPGKVKVGDRVVVMPQNGCGRCRLCLSGEHIRCQNQLGPEDAPVSSARATYAQYCLQQDWLLYHPPTELTVDEASMACCGLGPTFGAMQMMNVNSLDTVLVCGLGAVGLGAVVNAMVRGAKVIGIESHPYRVALAQSLGAEAVFDPADPDIVLKVREMTGGQGADKSIEASSSETGPKTLLDATRIGGELTSVGWGGPLRMADVVAKGVTIRGAWHWNHLRDGAAMGRTLLRAQPYLKKLITHRFPLDEVASAWELQATGNCGKIILKPWGP